MGFNPAIAAKLRYFEYGHLPKALRGTSRKFARLAMELANEEGASVPETVEALACLLRAKDAAVRARLGGDPQTRCSQLQHMLIEEAV